MKSPWTDGERAEGVVSAAETALIGAIVEDILVSVIKHADDLSEREAFRVVMAAVGVAVLKIAESFSGGDDEDTLEIILTHTAYMLDTVENRAGRRKENKHGHVRS